MNYQAYACYITDKKTRALSSSGGIFPLLAYEIIDHGGVLYGACYDDSLEVVHRRIETIEEICAAQGSKYVCSRLGDTFRQVEDDLKKGRTVLFTGTPCQAAGLLSFLKVKNLPADNLYTVDCVCHGVPGRKPWRAYLQSLKKLNLDPAAVNMRDKSMGWTGGRYAWRITLKDGSSLVIPRTRVTYMKGMLANLYLRPSCHVCSFKGTQRETDLTLGDYWGIESHLPGMNDNKGTSLVLIHSEKGSRLFERCRFRMKAAKADLDKAVAANACIVRPTPGNPKREQFFRRLEAGEDFVSLTEELAKTSMKKRIAGRIGRLVRGDFRPRPTDRRGK